MRGELECARTVGGRDNGLEVEFGPLVRTGEDCRCPDFMGVVKSCQPLVALPHREDADVQPVPPCCYDIAAIDLSFQAAGNHTVAAVILDDIINQSVTWAACSRVDVNRMLSPKSAGN